MVLSETWKHETHESMDSTCMDSNVEAAGGAVFKCQFCLWPRPPYNDHGLLPAGSSQNGVLIMTMSTSGNWHICSNCVMLSCQYGPKSFQQFVKSVPQRNEAVLKGKVYLIYLVQLVNIFLTFNYVWDENNNLPLTTIFKIYLKLINS